MTSEFHEMLNDYREVKQRKRDIEHAMADYVMRYKGSIADAYREGMIRFNFACPDYVKRSIINEDR